MATLASTIDIFDGRLKLGSFSKNGRVYALANAAGKKIGTSTSRAEAVTAVVEAAKAKHGRLN
jgi:hypothetical protein